MPIKPRRFVELKCGLVFPAREEHDLVAAFGPGMRKCVRQDRLAVPLFAVMGVSDDIFDNTVRATTASEVGYDGDGAT